MRIHTLYHEPYEGCGNIKDWANLKGYKITETALYNNDPLPEINDFDMLVVMGGAMSANDEEKYNWLKQEKKLIRSASESGKAVFGICLGAQLIASAFGARVYPNKHKEIGWFPVEFHKNGLNPSLKQILPNKLTVFHWHGETFDNPPGSIVFASSEATPNQAFIMGKQVIGLQFHLEMTLNDIKEICEAGKNELVESIFIQTENQILSQKDFIEATNKLMFDILNYLENSFLSGNS